MKNKPDAKRQTTIRMSAATREKLDELRERHGTATEVIAVAIDRLYLSQGKSSTRIETLETAIRAVLRYISSHQVYDKDAKGILERALSTEREDQS